MRSQYIPQIRSKNPDRYCKPSCTIKVMMIAVKTLSKEKAHAEGNLCFFFFIFDDINRRCVKSPNIHTKLLRLPSKERQHSTPYCAHINKYQRTNANTPRRFSLQQYQHPSNFHSIRYSPLMGSINSIHHLISLLSLLHDAVQKTGTSGDESQKWGTWIQWTTKESEDPWNKNGSYLLSSG